MAKRNKVIKKTVSYTLPPDLIEYIEERRKRENRSKSNLVAVLLRQAKEAESLQPAAG